MPDPPLAALIMAGGLGTRMRSAVPKHFHPILGRRLVDWVIGVALEAGAAPVVVVASPSGSDQFEGQPVTVAVQEEPLGTGDAARSARNALAAYTGDVLVLSGDTPLLTAELLRRAARDPPRRAGRGDDPQRQARRSARLRPRRPRRRRLGAPDRRGHRRDTGGARDRRDQLLDLRVPLGRCSVAALERLQPKNVQGELYLTDVIALLVEAGERVSAHVAAELGRD